MREWISLLEDVDSEPLDSVEDLIYFAQFNRIKLNIEEEGDSLLLTWISRGHRAKKGSGALVMRELCLYADAYHKTIYLDAMHGDPKLIQYYEQFGFVLDDGADERAEWIMSREPR